ncbi:hypothetical protein [Pollutimonas subterranea]|uniref:hypothetical protein n=1 Tax=Pollutimonas subterranea TaxID=2045210 RepID=UPI000C7D5ACF|nr:hypothetical protein [Pollutimonas subterranea]
MITPGKDIRLTDELERQLMMQAIEEQFRFKPLEALKGLFAKLAALLPRSKVSNGQAAQTAS